MYLKVSYESNKQKKLAFNEKYRQVNEFTSEMSKLTNIPAEKIKIVGLVNDNDEIQIDSNEEMARFITANKNSRFLELRIERNEDQSKLPQAKHELQTTFPFSTGHLNNLQPDVSINSSQNPSLKELQNSQRDADDVQEFFREKFGNNRIFEPIKIKDSEPYSIIEQKQQEKEVLKKKESQKKISEAQTIIQMQKKEIINQLATVSSEVEKSTFDMEILDRILALEKRLNNVNNEIISQSKVALQQNQPEIKVQNFVQTNQVLIKTRHLGHKCSGCLAFPIEGRMFTCLECNHYEVCQTCEKKQVHEHPMIRSIVRTNIDHIHELQKSYKNYKLNRQDLPVPDKQMRPLETNLSKNRIIPIDQINKKAKMEDEKKELLKFIDVDSRLNQNETLRKYEHLNVEEFIQAVAKMLR